jgi:hypothetical protein
VNTAVATIGIRGTEYTIAYTNSISGSVGEGEIEVCTTRCVPFGSGESFFVPNAETLPQLTTKQTNLPPTQPNENAPALIAGNETNPDGTPAGLILAGKQELDGIYVAGFASNYFSLALWSSTRMGSSPIWTASFLPAASSRRATTAS